MSAEASLVAAVRGRPVELDPAADAAVADRRDRGASRLARRDSWATLTIGALFLAAALPFALAHDSARHPSAAVVAALVVAYAFLYRVEFEFGSGSAVPTQLLLVPMLFLLPLGHVPFAVAAGIMLANIAEHAEGRIHVTRIFVRLSGSWHALGPVLVLAVDGEHEPALDRWPVYVAAFAAQVALDLGAAAVRERLALGLPVKVLLGYISRAWVVDAALAPVGLLTAIVAMEHGAAILLVLPLVGLLQVFARERRARVDHALTLSHAYRGTALLLGDVVEADDAYTGGHSREVVDLVLAVADELDLDARQRRDAEFVALLHDVGKIRIPAQIIDKPGPLTPEERTLIETHTIEGERMLVQVGGVLGEVGRLVRSCHEFYDGTGYPDGLAGDDIPLVARIVCCCDAFSAITADRPYRTARSVEEALAELGRCAGTHFDPLVVEALARTVKRESP